jgi:DNA-directed RNA polymerase specialized sigma subunit
MSDDLNKAYETWTKDQTPAGNVRFLESMRPVMQSAVKTYVGNDDPTAMSHAKMLTLGAARKFDPKNKNQLRTYLLTQMQPLRRFAAKRRFVTHIPESVQYEASGIHAATKDLAEQLGRDPSDMELADKTGLSLKRLKHVRAFAAPRAEGVPLDTESMDPAVQFNKPMDEWTDFVYHDLEDVDRKVMEWRTGYNGNPVLSTTEIAKRLGLSLGAVSQRVNKITARIEEGLKYAR